MIDNLIERTMYILYSTVEFNNPCWAVIFLQNEIKSNEMKQKYRNIEIYGDVVMKINITIEIKQYHICVDNIFLFHDWKSLYLFII